MDHYLQEQETPGHRKLSLDEANAMGGVRHVEKQWNGIVDYLRTLPGIDQRQVSIAATVGEEAFMRAIRAVAQPQREVSAFIPFEPA